MSECIVWAWGSLGMVKFFFPNTFVGVAAWMVSSNNFVWLYVKAATDGSNKRTVSLFPFDLEVA